MSTILIPVSEIFQSRPIRTEGLNPRMLEMPVPDSRKAFVRGTWQGIATLIGAIVLSAFAQNVFAYSVILSESSTLLGLGAYAFTMITGFWGMDQIFQLAKRSYYSFIDAFRQKDLEIKDHVIRELRMIEKLSPEKFEQYLHRKVGLPKIAFDLDDLDHLKKLNPRYPFEPLKTYLAYYLIHFRRYEEALKNHKHQMIVIEKTHPKGVSRDMALFDLQNNYEMEVLKKKLLAAYHLYLVIHPTETMELSEIGTLNPLPPHKRQELMAQGDDPYFILFDGTVFKMEEVEKSTVLENALLLRS